MQSQHHRQLIWNSQQHPYKHKLNEFPYANPALPPGTVVNAEDAMNWVFAVLYPQTEAAVANVAALPAAGNTLNDMRVVLDDGDGKAASYRWEQREGEGSATWHKIYDMDWGEDSILQGFLLKTQDLYVKQQGYDDLDSAGSPVTGTLAGQSVYGGKSASTNLTLFANSGDGVGAATGFVQFGDNVRPTTTAVFDFGTTALRWAKGWFTTLQVGTLAVAGGSITDSSGAISFDNENLTTTGTLASGTHTIGNMVIATGTITNTGGSISFDNENLSTTGTLASGTHTIGTLVLAAASITDTSGTISFGDENLTTTGTISAGGLSIGSLSVDFLTLDGNTISTNSSNVDLNIAPNGTGTLYLDADLTNATGDLAVDGSVSTVTLDASNLRLTGNTISSTDSNGNIALAPNGTGWVTVSSKVLPTTDAAKDLGDAASRFQSLYLSGSIGDGTTTITNTVLQTLRDINVGVGSGYSLFWNGTKWVASAPDTEIDHGTVTGLADDDHTQYALLAGRSGGQTLKGSTLASENLALQSTNHATKGFITTDSVIKPTADGTIDLAASGASWKDVYVSGQLMGARLQNYTTAGRPAASAGTIGRIIYDTDLTDIMVDNGGAWKKLSQEKSITVDTTGWDGVAVSNTYDVSADISDARYCVWSLKNNANNHEQELCTIDCPTVTTVRVRVGVPLASGTYTLVGVG